MKSFSFIPKNIQASFILVFVLFIFFIHPQVLNVTKIEAKQPQSFYDLTSIAIPNLSSLPVTIEKTTDTYILGTVHINNKKIDIVILNHTNKLNISVLLLYKSQTFSNLIPGSKGPLFDSISFTKPIFIISSIENKGKTVNIPDDISSRTGFKTISLSNEVNFHAFANFTGETASLIKATGGTTENLTLKGAINSSFFSATTDTNIINKTINSIDFTVPLKGTPSWKPNNITLSNTKLTVKGINGSCAIKITTVGKVTLSGTKISLPRMTFQAGPQKGEVTLSSEPFNPERIFKVPLTGLTLNEMSFSAVIASNRATITFPGKFTYGKVNGTYSAIISNSNFSLKLSESMPLSLLTGYTIAGLGNINATEITIGNTLISASLKIVNKTTDIVLFTPQSKSIPNLAILMPSFSFGDIIPALQSTPFDNLTITKGMFMYVPKGNQNDHQDLPEDISKKTGKKSMETCTGFNITGNVSVTGEAKNLISAAGISTSGLTLTGTLSPDIFSLKKGTGSIGSTIINMIDVTIPIGPITLPDYSFPLETAQNSFKIKGKNGVLTGSVHSEITVKPTGKPYTFSCTIGLDTSKKNKTFVIDGTYPKTIDHIFSIPWINLRDVKLHIVLGDEKSLIISGTTDIGNLSGVTVKSFFMMENNIIVDAGIELTGHSIPLNSIPLLKNIPFGNKFQLKDLTISKRSIGCTLLNSSVPVFNNLTGVLFESNEKWHLMGRKDNFTFSELFPSNQLVKNSLQLIHLNKAALVLCDGDINSKMEMLPYGAQQELKKIYGSTDRDVEIKSGLNLLSSIAPLKLSKNNDTYSPQFDSSNIVLGGGIGGLFGGPLSLNLAAEIPPVKFPQLIQKFIIMPTSVGTSFYVRLTEDSAAVGIELKTDFNVTMKNQVVPFDSTLDFQLDSEGGFTIILGGKTDGPWKNPLDIKGITMKSGTSIYFSASATSEMTFTLTGNAYLLGKDITLSGAIGLVDLIPAEVAMKASISEISTDDLVSLTDVILTEGYNLQKPAKPDFPKVTLKGVDIVFASPGRVGKTYNLGMGGGLHLAGTLYFLLKDAPLGTFNGTITDAGLVMTGNISQFTIGPFTMKENKLDVNLQASILNPPHFKIIGNCDLFGKSQKFIADFSLTKMDFQTTIDSGDLCKYDFHAWGTMPASGLSPQELSKIDFGLHSSLSSDIPSWLRTTGKDYISSVFTSLKKTFDDANTNLENAKQKVSDCQKKIDDAINALKTPVEKQISNLDKKIKPLQKKENNYLKKLKGCHIKHWKKWLASIFLTNPGKWAKCSKALNKYAQKLLNVESDLKPLQAKRFGYQKTLDGLNSGDGLKQIDQSLISAKNDADDALNTAQSTVTACNNVNTYFNTLLNTVSTTDFHFNSLIQGDLQKFVLGKPAIACISYQVGSSQYNKAMALKSNNSTFNNEQFEVIALDIACKIVKKAYDNNTDYKILYDTLKNSYDKKNKDVKKNLQQALKANNITLKNCK